MGLAERIEKVREATGFVDDDAARAVEEYEGWHYGDRVRVIEGDDDSGAFEGEEGYVILGEVGAPQYGNVRTSLGILLDGTDCPVEVDAYGIEAA